MGADRPTLLVLLSISSSSCRSWPRLCIAGSVKLWLLPGCRSMTLCSLVCSLQGALLAQLLEAAVPLLPWLPLLLLLRLPCVLVRGGPLLPCSVTDKAAWAPVSGRLLVTTVTCKGNMWSGHHRGSSTLLFTAEGKTPSQHGLQARLHSACLYACTAL